MLQTWEESFFWAGLKPSCSLQAFRGAAALVKDWGWAFAQRSLKFEPPKQSWQLKQVKTSKLLRTILVRISLDPNIQANDFQGKKKQWILTDFDPATLGLEQEKLGEGCLGKKGIRTSNKPKIFGDMNDRSRWWSPLENSSQSEDGRGFLAIFHPRYPVDSRNARTMPFIKRDSKPSFENAATWPWRLSYLHRGIKACPEERRFHHRQRFGHWYSRPWLLMTG